MDPSHELGRTSEFDAVRDAMADPGFYPHGPRAVDVRETTISLVFLAGERVYKLKKPVRLPFLDYRDPRRRRELCAEEVRLNRRLAPEVYRGVRAVVRRGERLELAEEDDPAAVEWAVEMERLPEERTLAALLEACRLEPEAMRRVGRRIADFHAEVEVPDEPAGVAAVKRSIDENFQPLLDLELPPVDRGRLASAARFFDAFLVAHRDLLARRAAGGRVRDGHGDLRLEHVLVVDDGVLAYDCVEFDAALRCIDVSADLAYLVMELGQRGAPGLAAELVDAYRQAGGDPGGDALVSFYAAYRAWVRAKLAYLTGGDPSGLVAVAERFRWLARRPLVIALGGVTASGKSHLAGALAAITGVEVMSSDRVRKELGGVPVAARAPAEHYRPAVSRRTYRMLGTRAAAQVRRDGVAIVDATFRDLADRDAFRAGLGEQRRAAVFVECRAPRAVLLDRARARERQPERVSDATADLVDRHLAEWEPLDEVDPRVHLVLRSDRDVATVVDDLEAALDSRMAAGRSGAGAQP